MNHQANINYHEMIETVEGINVLGMANEICVLQFASS